MTAKALKSSSAVDTFLAWKEHPLQFVREVFEVEPDPWQAEALEAFPHNQQMAMKACKGPGKTALLSWLAWNFLVTRPHPKIAATSITGDNLRDNLWTEMSKWQQRSQLLTNGFTWTKARIFAKAHPETWWMSARPWSKSANAEELGLTLAGLHADYILFILDESGGIPKAIMVSAEAALSSPIEGHIVQAGNPTHLEGPLYEACVLHRHAWHVIEITGDPDDPKRSSRISVEWARDQIKKYGADSPWVLVNVFGKFPPSSLNALIGPDEVRAAMGRMYREFELKGMPRILGVDTALFGDDTSVICPRQGLQVFPMQTFRGLTPDQGAGQVARKSLDWQADAVFIDNTGGFGSGWISHLQQMGHKPVGIGFAEKSMSDRYMNKRAEMYFDAIDWIKGGGALPDIPELLAALTQTTYAFKGDKMILEPKEVIKEKLGYSPDHADALALTFAHPVLAKKPASVGVQRSRHTVAYDPMAEENLPWNQR